MTEQIVYKVYRSGGYHYDYENNCWTRKKTYKWPVFYNIKDANRFSEIDDFIIEMKCSNSRIISTIAKVIP